MSAATRSRSGVAGVDVSPAERHFDAASREVQPARSYDTRDLFGGDTEIEITHQQKIYRLKITRQGKLILNK